MKKNAAYTNISVHKTIKHMFVLYITPTNHKIKVDDTNSIHPPNNFKCAMCLKHLIIF